MRTDKERLEWHRVAALDELPEGRVKTVTASIHSMALTHIDGEYHAMENRCPRAIGRGVDRNRQRWSMLVAVPVARLGLRSEDGRFPGRA